MLAIPARVITTCFVIVCFAGTIVVGLYHGNAWTSILLSALIVAMLAWPVGYVVGWLFLRTVNEHIAKYREEKPIPQEDAPNTEPVEAAAG